MLAQGIYLLEKFPGKGGWTYAVIPEATPPSNTPFGWLRVKGEIDGHPLAPCKLMPMGDGQRLFLPINAMWRKKLGKQAGDRVSLTLHLHERPAGIPQEIRDCFEQEPPAVYERFLAYPPMKQSATLDYIYDARTEEVKAQRIADLLERLSNNN